MNKRKSMRILDGICKTNKKVFCDGLWKNACELDFFDHLWLPFINQQRLDVVVSSIIYFRIYKNLIT